MKILLLRPNSGIPVAPPPIGLMYLAGYLRKMRPGLDEISILDGRSELPTDNQVADVIREKQPDLVGITAFSMEQAAAHRYAKLAKAHSPDCTTIIGGPYGTSDYNAALEDESLDFTARGEGEITFHHLIETLENGNNIDKLRGIAYRNNSNIVAGSMPELHDNIDEIPYPAWDMIDLVSYFHFGKVRRLTNPIQMRERGISIFSTRGCPYQCTYCHNVFGKKLRKRSVENVLGELKWLVDEFRVNEIEFIDDVFNLDRDRAKAICDGIVENSWDLKMSFPNGLRADQMDEELVDKMKAAGTYRINYAVESGTPRVQKMIKKNLELDRAMEIINYTASRGISTGGFFMLGFRDETEEEAWSTINFAMQSKLHTASFFILTPFPNTPMYQEALDLGYNMDGMFSDYGAISTNLSKMTNEQLETLRKLAFRKFYFDPKRILSIFITTPRKWNLFKNFLRAARMSMTGKEF
ncbi:B12-binding domain-containing radical SAM protein [bacterium]|nr:B12-binding domain-containing radical SAM protein [bacterium]